MTANRQSVLIAIDGGSDSERVIQAATEYLDREACHLRIAVVVPALAGELAALHDDTLGSWPIREMQAGLESEMTEVAKAIAAKFDVAPESVAVLFGRPADQLAEYCTANAIDLVILGLHRSAANQIGSTTLGLLQQSSCDVMTVRLG